MAAIEARMDSIYGLDRREEVTPVTHPGADTAIGPCYAYLAPERIFARTVEVNPSVMVEVDADGRVIGVETLDGSDWTAALATLAVRGRVRVV